MLNNFFLYRSWTVINIEQIVKNYIIYKETAKSDIIAVVKANAYGHGDSEVSHALEDAGVSFFAVSNIIEGINLRKSGVKGKILILGYTPKSHLYLLEEYSLIQTIVSEKYLEELKIYAPKDTEYHLAVDTGMHRIGIPAENTVKMLKNYEKTLKITGIFTHLSVADSEREEDKGFTDKSLDVFYEIAESVKSKHIHCLNSAGGLKYNKTPFNTVRLGISLYGYPPSEDFILPKGIAPALEWKTKTACILDVKAGESIGYGRSYTAKRNMKVATLMTGYADGYPRMLSNKGKVLINGEFAHVVGKVCMDMMMVDVTDIKNVKPGDTAVLIGKSGDKKITADDIARPAETISYEILTGISARVQKLYY